MTETDKIEIGNLLNGMKEMANYAKKTNEFYLDDKIVDFAAKAKEDYLNNKDSIKTILKGNLGMFLNLNALKIGRSEGIDAMHNQKVGICIGNNLHIIIRLTDFVVIENTCYHTTFNVKDFEIYDIFFRTSNTDDPNYGICCWENLVDMCESGFVFDKPTNTKQWQYIYNRALRTRQMNSLLVEKFKQTMKDRIAYYQSVANDNEKTKISTSNVGVYIKVDL